MATPLGDVRFDANGMSHVMRFGANALVAVEDRTGKKLNGIIADMQDDPSFTLIRVLFWAGLLKRQPDMTEDQAGDLMDEVGLARAGDLVGQAFTAAFPTEKDAAANPPKPRATKATRSDGTGSPS